MLKVKKGGTELVELKYEYENGVLLQQLTQKEGSSLVKLTLERDTLRRGEKQHVKMGLQPLTTTAQTYNEVDWAITRTPPKSPVQTFEHYANGLAARRTIGPARWTSTYDPGGRLKTLEAPVGSIETREYTARSELEKAEVVGTNGQTYKSEALIYTPGGNVEQRIQAHLNLVSRFGYVGGVYWADEEEHEPGAGSPVEASAQNRKFDAAGNPIEIQGSPKRIFAYNDDN